MKQKIYEALQRKYASKTPQKGEGTMNLGLSDNVFERVAILGQTFIKDESEIEGFVNNAESMLKGFQSEGDRLRTELNQAKKQIDELTKAIDPAPAADPVTPPATTTTTTTEELSQMLADAVRQAVEPFQQRLESIEKSKQIEDTIATAKKNFNENGHVKVFKEEGEDAWERAYEMYEATGKSLTAEELTNKAMGYFNKMVKRKGVDTSKPVESQGSGSTHDFSALANRLRAQGKLPQAPAANV